MRGTQQLLCDLCQKNVRPGHVWCRRPKRGRLHSTADTEGTKGGRRQGSEENKRHSAKRHEDKFGNGSQGGNFLVVTPAESGTDKRTKGGGPSEEQRENSSEIDFSSDCTPPRTGPVPFTLCPRGKPFPASRRVSSVRRSSRVEQVGPAPTST